MARARVKRGINHSTRQLDGWKNPDVFIHFEERERSTALRRPSLKTHRGISTRDLKPSVQRGVWVEV